MKRNLLPRILAISILILTLPAVLASCEKSTILDTVPAEIEKYVTTHFPTHTIIQVMKDVDDLEVTYDVILSEGVVLEFNRRKEIIEIDSGTALPAGVIPDNILNHVNTNYPHNFIIGWELKDGKRQQIDLDNGLELLFDKSGKFIGID